MCQFLSLFLCCRRPFLSVFPLSPPTHQSFRFHIRAFVHCKLIFAQAERKGFSSSIRLCSCAAGFVEWEAAVHLPSPFSFLSRAAVGGIVLFPSHYDHIGTIKNAFWFSVLYAATSWKCLSDLRTLMTSLWLCGLFFLISSKVSGTIVQMTGKHLCVWSYLIDWWLFVWLLAHFCMNTVNLLITHVFLSLPTLCLQKNVFLNY